MELINKKDAIHAVLHNQGDAAVAAVQNIKPINPHGELREMLIDGMIDRANRPKNNAELIKALRYCSDNEKQDGCDECPYLHNGMCRTMLSDAAYALEAADKRIADLEAQIPKEGEWVRNDKEQDGFDDVVWRYAKCTVCGDSRFSYYAARKNFRYCPTCGAKMKGANDEQIH